MYENEIIEELSNIEGTPQVEAKKQEDTIPEEEPATPAKIEAVDIKADKAQQLRQFVPYQFSTNYYYKDTSHLYQVIMEDGTEVKMEASSAQDVAAKCKGKAMRQIIYLGPRLHKIVDSEDLGGDEGV